MKIKRDERNNHTEHTEKKKLMLVQSCRLNLNVSNMFFNFAFLASPPAVRHVCDELYFLIRNRKQFRFIR